jgi:hypothetical protein
VALQTNVVFSPSCTAWSTLVSSYNMSGGTAGKRKYHHQINSQVDQSNVLENMYESNVYIYFNFFLKSADEGLIKAASFFKAENFMEVKPKKCVLKIRQKLKNKGSY